MTAHERLTPEIEENAALYALGVLPVDEISSFEAHAAICAVCARQVSQFQESATQLGLTAEQRMPHPRVREMLLARINRLKPSLPEGVSVVRSDEGKWRPTPFAGVKVKSLHVDPTTEYMTSLVRMAPGATYPAHRHSGAEQCLVLEGDVRLGDVSLEAGDYERAEAQTIHGTIETKSGCLLLLISSQRDEILEGRS